MTGITSEIFFYKTLLFILKMGTLPEAGVCLTFRNMPFSGAQHAVFRGATCRFQGFNMPFSGLQHAVFRAATAGLSKSELHVGLQTSDDAVRKIA